MLTSSQTAATFHKVPPHAAAVRYIPQSIDPHRCKTCPSVSVRLGVRIILIVTLLSISFNVHFKYNLDLVYIKMKMN